MTKSPEPVIPTQTQRNISKHNLKVKPKNISKPEPNNLNQTQHLSTRPITTKYPQELEFQEVSKLFILQIPL